MPIDLTARVPQPRKEWVVTGRFVFVTIVLFFLVVATVNGIMMTLAIRTFSGVDAKNGYDLSQNYNNEIAAARAQAALGWHGTLSVLPVETGSRVAFALNDRLGAPVSGLQMTAEFRHPSDRRHDRQLALVEAGAGHYEAQTSGLTGVSWNIRLIGMRDTDRVYVSDLRQTIR